MADEEIFVRQYFLMRCEKRAGLRWHVVEIHGYDPIPACGQKLPPDKLAFKFGGYHDITCSRCRGLVYDEYFSLRDLKQKLEESSGDD